jgi:hypothetical protein
MLFSPLLHSVYAKENSWERPVMQENCPILTETGQNTRMSGGKRLKGKGYLSFSQRAE